MTISSLFSPGRIRRNISLVVRRFPIATIFILAWTLYMFIHIIDGPEISRSIYKAFQWAIWSGFGLSVAVSLWTEVLGKQHLAKPLQLGTIALAILYFAVCAVCGDGGVAGGVGRSAFAAAIAAAIIFGPARPDFSSTRALSYTIGQLSAGVSGMVLAGVLGMALSIIFYTISILFGNFNDTVIEIMMVLFAGTLPLLVYLRLIPGHAAAQRRACTERTGIARRFRTVMLPLVCIYMAILYVYMSKIIITWTLPDGELSWMVTFCTAAVLITLYFMQPLVREGDSVSTLARRLLPPLLLPLVALMAVGLAYRMNEYGPTASRIYVALFAIWAAAAAIYLTAHRRVHFNMLAMTFACGFFIVSAIPGLNVCSLTDRYIYRQLEETFADYRLPMNESKIKEALAAMPRRQAELAASRIEYLDHWDDHSRVAGIVRSDTRLYSSSLLPDTASTYHGMLSYRGGIDIPEGFTHMNHFSVTYSDSVSSLCTDSVAVITLIDPEYSRPDRFDKLEGYIFTR